MDDLSLAVGDGAGKGLLELEQALHRREALIVVTSSAADACSHVVRSALARFADAFLVIQVSAADGEPVRALDSIVASSGEDLRNASAEERRQALVRVTREAATLGRPIIVAVLDAERASTADLEKLRTALGLEQGPIRTIQLVLAGTSELVAKLKRRDALGIWTRVTTHVEVASARGSRSQAPSASTTLPSRSARSWRRPRTLAAVAAAALVLVAATLSLRSGVERPQRVAQATVQPARRIAARPEAAGKPQAPPLRPAGTDGVANVALPGSQVPGDAGAVQALLGEGKASGGGPSVDEWLGVETVRGTAPNKAKAVASDESKQEIEAAAAAASAQPDARHARRGAQVVTVEPGPERGGKGAPAKPILVEPVAVAKAQSRAETAARERSSSAAAASDAAVAAEPAGTRSSAVASASAGTGSSTVTSEPAGTSKSAPASETAVGSKSALARETAGASETAVDAPRAPGRSSSAPKPAPALASASGPSRAGIQLQVAAFAKVVNAEALRDELAGVFEHVHVEETSVAGKTWFRVRVGPFDTSAEAGSAEQRLKEMGHAPVRYGRPKTT